MNLLIKSIARLEYGKFVCEARKFTRGFARGNQCGKEPTPRLSKGQKSIQMP